MRYNVGLVDLAGGKEWSNKEIVGPIPNPSIILLTILTFAVKKL
jgi:hypothetical protein